MEPYTALRQLPATAARLSLLWPVAFVPAEEFNRVTGYTEEMSRVVTAMPSMTWMEGGPMPAVSSPTRGVSTSTCTSTVRFLVAVDGFQKGWDGATQSV